MDGIPHVVVSYAQSVDGRLATKNGDSKWISGPETIRLAHELRRDNDAILVGIGTVLKDDPELTCRIPDSDSPCRVILDSKLRIPITSSIVRTSREIKTIIICADGASDERKKRLESRDITVQTVSIGIDDRLDLLEILTILYRNGFRSVFVEGGSAVITSFLKGGFVNRMIIVVAPIIIGEGIPAVGDLDVSTLSEILKPASHSVRKQGEDLVWELQFHE